ncbi:MAG: TlpA disulfide reductase family protein [Kofleriaceae bacterium]
MRFWCLLLIAACASQPQTVATPQVPVSAYAQIEASVDLDGKPVGHVDLPTVVIVFASWCPHCREELPELAALHGARILGVNYRGHEEYDHRGNSEAVRAFSERNAWLRIVPIDDTTFAALGSPSKIPSIYVFDRTGKLTATFVRTERAPPKRDELAAALR